MVFPVLPDWPPEVRPVTAEFPHCSVFPPRVDAAVSQHAAGDGAVAGKMKGLQHKGASYTPSHSHLHTPMPSQLAQSNGRLGDLSVCVCRLVVHRMNNQLQCLVQTKWMAEAKRTLTSDCLA